MNLFDVISYKEFLVKVFPKGLSGDVLVGQIGITPFSDTKITVHTRQQPEIEIKKWGKWGETFNTVAIVLGSGTVKGLLVKNIYKASYAALDVQKVERGFRLKQMSGEWEIDFTVEDLVFDKCMVYMDEAD
ncbi:MULTISPECIES: hypothetical protein [Pseudomonas]|uniref:Uncharacterized protein n=1 Tax=Pseudomonas quercus TaxID=2722792 RepID=A0ABX0YJG1_9PSED|nr:MULTISPECIES: hypothetical protein [Pseudomonas]MBF7143648.1 hypothetical protein [Pseudomonas sp. LY10J]NJP02314.1 hypothetical protein [Pseudomonas quercus]